MMGGLKITLIPTKQPILFRRQLEQMSIMADIESIIESHISIMLVEMVDQLQRKELLMR